MGSGAEGGPGAQPGAPELHQPAYGKGDQQPEVGARPQNGQQTDVDTFGLRRLLPIQLTSISILVVAQLVWLALLAYGAYWIWQRLPF